MDDVISPDEEVEEEDFEVSHIEEGLEEADITEEDLPKPGDKVRISFSRFVQLIASHNFDKILEKRKDEELIMGADLLADLASVHEEKDGNRIPLIFIGGIVLGAVLTYFLIKM